VISGIIPLLRPEERGIPYLLAIESWAEVLDEMIVVIDMELGTVSEEQNAYLSTIAEAAKGKCKVETRGIIRPHEHNVFRMFGYFFANRPDWIVHFDADYLISHEEALKLKRCIENASDDVDCMTYELVYLNYDATAVFYNKDMEYWFAPHSGYSAFFPFVINPRRGNFLCPFEGHANDGRYINFEGVINMSDRWGKSFFPKYGMDTPHFNVVQTNVVVEHLSWSMNEEPLRKKVQHAFWQDLGIDMDTVLHGMFSYGVSYPLLDEARKRYKAMREEWNGV